MTHRLKIAPAIPEEEVAQIVKLIGTMGYQATGLRQGTNEMDVLECAITFHKVADVDDVEKVECHLAVPTCPKCSTVDVDYPTRQKFKGDLINCFQCGIQFVFLPDDVTAPDVPAPDVDDPKEAASVDAIEKKLLGEILAETDHIKRATIIGNYCYLRETLYKFKPVL